MTFGQLFMTMHPDVRVIGNGSCVWLFMDEVNHYTIATKWWNQEVAGYALDLLKEQEAVSPDYEPTTLSWSCGNCGQSFDRCKYKYCPTCGKKVKWDE